MKRNWVKFAVVIFLVLLPFVVRSAYRRLTTLPDQITIATGPPGGQFLSLSGSLAKAIEEKLPIQVRTVPTNGSLENLSLLRAGKADFGLYQTWTVEILSEFDTDVLNNARVLTQEREAKNVQFIANLYSQPAHFITRRDAGIKSPADLKGKTVNLGLKESGDYAMSLVLLDHFGLSRNSIEPRYLDYTKLKQGFLDDTLDAAFITIGVQAPIFPELFETGKCDILSIPYSEALSARHVPMYQYKVPAGRYRYQRPAAPATDIYTVALGTQLLTHSHVDAGLVEEVTKIVLSEEFLKKNRLGELFGKGSQFAREAPEFAMHPGAKSFYNPELRPLLDPGFVEATEGMRSFIASFVIAAIFGIGWMRKRKIRQREHKLEGYMKKLLEIEKQQIALGTKEDVGDAENLQELLDRVTDLRQEALGKLSAHELSEDPAAGCFIEMCHALSNKINAKISRQRLDKRLAEISVAISRWKGATTN